MTTGTIDFITNSGLITPIEAIPTPDFAVPYAAPKPENLAVLRHVCVLELKGQRRSLAIEETCSHLVFQPQHISIGQQLVLTQAYQQGFVTTLSIEQTHRQTLELPQLP